MNNRKLNKIRKGKPAAAFPSRSKSRSVHVRYKQPNKKTGTKIFQKRKRLTRYPDAQYQQQQYGWTGGRRNKRSISNERCGELEEATIYIYIYTVWCGWGVTGRGATHAAAMQYEPDLLALYFYLLFLFYFNLI